MLGVALGLSGLDVRGSRMFSGEKVATIAANIVEAVAEFRSHRPEISLMDLCLPGTDGWSFEESFPRLASSY